MKTTENTFPLWVWIAYFIFFALSIPWYLATDLEMRLILGLPLWIICNILAIFLGACFTVWVVNKYWLEPEGKD